MDNPILFTKWRNALATLYPDEASARRIVADAGINALFIRFNAEPINFWHAILTEAVQTEKFNTLIQIVLQEYGSNQELQALYALHRQFVAGGGRFIPLQKDEEHHTAIVGSNARKLAILGSHYRYLLIITALQIPLAFLFFQYRYRYGISWSVYLALALLLVAVAWSWCAVLNAQLSRTSMKRPLLIASILAMVWSGGVFYQVQSTLAPPKLAADKFGITVALFSEGSDFQVTGRTREFNELLLSELKATINTTPGIVEKVDLQPAGFVRSVEQATMAGTRVGAELVMWGHILEGKECVVIYFYLLDSSWFTDDAVSPRALPLVNLVVDRPIDICGDTILDVRKVASQLNLGLAALSLGLYHYVREQDFSDAAQQFEIALKLLKNAGRASAETNLGLLYYYLGKSYQLQGDYERSQTMLEQAARLNPTDPVILLGQAYNYGAMNQKEKKQDALKQVFDLINQFPRDQVAVNYNRALAYEVQGDDDSAWREYQAILQCNRELSACTSPFFPAYLSAGRTLLRLSRLDDARMIYTRAADLAKGKAEMEFWLKVEWGQFYEKNTQSEEALSYYTSAITQNDQFALPYLYRARLYETMAIPDAALLDYQKVVKLSDNQSFAHTMLGGFFYRLKLYNEAIEQYRQALHGPLFDQSLIHAYIGQSFAALQQEKQAFQEFATALETASPSEAYIRSAFGIVLQQFGHTDAAISQMEQSLALNTQIDVETSLNLGQLYESRKKWNKAKALYMSLLASGNQLPSDKQQVISERLNGLQADPISSASRMP